MPDFAVRVVAKPFMAETLQLVTAETIEAARNYVISRSSVSVIKSGITITVAPVGWENAASWSATYEGDEPKMGGEWPDGLLTVRTAPV